jgi:hypothetical protein
LTEPFLHLVVPDGNCSVRACGGERIVSVLRDYKD